MPLTPLNRHTLGALTQHLPDGMVIDTPRYRRELNKRICHIGLGNFHRSHLAWYLHELLQVEPDQAWGICAIALMPADRPLLKALSRQDGLYSLWAESRDNAPAATIVGSIMELLDASESSAAAIERMTLPETHIVSLTITEKGYCLTADGELDCKNPLVAGDLLRPSQPRSAIGVIVQALAVRRERCLPAFTVMSCDNLIANGHRCRQAVLAYAAHIDLELASWIELHCRFPLSMVDRITPKMDTSQQAYYHDLLGLKDDCVLSCERWIQWVLEDAFATERPAFERVGVTFSSHVHHYEKVKVGMLNGAHSALAQIGLLLDYVDVDKAAADADIALWLDHYMQEVQSVCQAPSDFDLDDYRRMLLTRFQNPAIKDSLYRLLEDSSTKFQQVLLPPLQERLARNLKSPTLIAALAFWVLLLRNLKTPAQQSRYLDPAKDRYIALAQQTDTRAGCKALLNQLFPLSEPLLNHCALALNSTLASMEQASDIRAWLQQQNGQPNLQHKPP